MTVVFKRGWFHSDITTDNFLRWQVLTTILPRCTLYSIALQNLNPSTACFQEPPTLQLPYNCKTERAQLFSTRQNFSSLCNNFSSLCNNFFFSSHLCQNISLSLFLKYNAYVICIYWYVPGISRRITCHVSDTNMSQIKCQIDTCVPKIDSKFRKTRFSFMFLFWKTQTFIIHKHMHLCTFCVEEFLC